MDLRADLPEPIPSQLLKLPVHRGYPVPYFVAWLDGEQPVARGQGVPDFRVLFPDVVRDCWFNERCWVCGGFMHSSWQSFVIGPMCSITRTSAEPGGHYECAQWAAKACPFLARPHARRRDFTDSEFVRDAPGEMIDRNPGASCVWTSRNAYRFPDGRGGFLFNVGDPSQQRPPEWYANGRLATREEVMDSINSGLPILDESCDRDRDPDESRAVLAQQVAAVTDHLIPA